MTFKDCLILVLVSCDNDLTAIAKQIQGRCPGCAVGFVHLPINGNELITTNCYYDALVCPVALEREVVVVVHDSMLNADLQSDIEEFKKGRNASAQKPIVRKRLGSSIFEWCNEVELIVGVVVAKRIDLFNALTQQQGQKK